jgi:hypothetical protein
MERAPHQRNRSKLKKKQKARRIVSKYLLDIARQKPTDNFPVEIDTTLDNFERFKGKWLRYRRVGSFDANGNFRAPISFLEAEQLPKIMIDTFRELDFLYAIAQRIAAKEKGAK